MKSDKSWAAFYYSKSSNMWTMGVKPSERCVNGGVTVNLRICITFIHVGVYVSFMHLWHQPYCNLANITVK